VVVQPIPGQESRNSDHLLQEGAAIRCNDLSTLDWEIDQLLGNPQRLSRMKSAAVVLGRENATRDIIATLNTDPKFPKVKKKHA